MATTEELKHVALFAGLTDDDLERVCTGVGRRRLRDAEVLFREGEPGDQAYVISQGQVEILRATEQREVLVAVRGPGDVVGEMALLWAQPRAATVRARGDVELLSVPKGALDDLLDTSPRAARTIFDALVARMREDEGERRHQERMAQLGTLTAGVAHELNNPAAAVGRGAQRLGRVVEELIGALGRVAPAGEGGLLAAVQELAAREGGAPPPGSLARSDAETEVEEWLGQRGVDGAWEVAPLLVDAGIGVSDLDAFAERVGGVDVGRGVGLLVALVSVRATAAEVGTAAGRVSDIVGALKSHSYLDQAPVQQVDVIRGLEDTLVLLGHKTKHVAIERDYDEGVPPITALGSELNQVWTNLIDNACDALEGVPEAERRLRLRVARVGDDVRVEVEDNGPGIPEEIRDRIFDPFFTTKAPGKGTGLGLQLSWRIVVLEHGGELEVGTEPGRTVFTVMLPIAGPSGAGPAVTDPAPAGSDERGENHVVTVCDHLEDVEDALTRTDGCQECLETGGRWLHLRACVACGHVGCCDQSPNRHARAHAETVAHPVIRSAEPGEHWAYCFEDDLTVAFR